MQNLFSRQHDIYPLIDPSSHFISQTYASKVVLVTGGGTGIGAHTALYYVKAGARVALVGRRVERLEERKSIIEKEVPGAQVLIVAGDISEPEVGKSIVTQAVNRWGRIDVVIANSALGMGGADRLGTKDPAAWWYTQEVIIRGTLNIIHPALPELVKTKGHIIVTTSGAAHMRLPLTSDYIVSKYAIGRFAEILALDYPELSVYIFNPGAIATPGALEAQAQIEIKGTIQMPDSIDLPAATCLWLTDHNNLDAKFLSGRYVEASWDLNEVLAKKEEIVRDDLLVTKLAGPVEST
ncbi:unnamed protein product [Peniophora sp. CBMAI 1063]|nr:unnamed protein product [Peniophora sp. CBMAI 1063]